MVYVLSQTLPSTLPEGPRPLPEPPFRLQRSRTRSLSVSSPPLLHFPYLFGLRTDALSYLSGWRQCSDSCRSTPSSSPRAATRRSRLRSMMLGRSLFSSAYACSSFSVLSIADIPCSSGTRPSLPLVSQQEAREQRQGQSPPPPLPKTASSHNSWLT